jgi:hypothetical protein
MMVLPPVRRKYREKTSVICFDGKVVEFVEEQGGGEIDATKVHRKDVGTL